MKCNGKYGFKKCVIDMDAQETYGGTICCDMAEDCDFNKEDILKRCEYAVPTDIKEAAIKELYS